MKCNLSLMVYQGRGTSRRVSDDGRLCSVSFALHGVVMVFSLELFGGGKMVFGSSLVKISCLIAVRLSCARLSLSIILACRSDKFKLHTENISEEG